MELAPPIVLTTKDDGALRFCIDYLEQDPVTVRGCWSGSKLGRVYGLPWKCSSIFDVESSKYLKIEGRQEDREKRHTRRIIVYAASTICRSALKMALDVPAPYGLHTGDGRIEIRLYLPLWDYLLSKLPVGTCQTCTVSTTALVTRWNHSWTLEVLGLFRNYRLIKAHQPCVNWRQPCTTWTQSATWRNSIVWRKSGTFFAYVTCQVDLFRTSLEYSTHPIERSVWIRCKRLTILSTKRQRR